MPERRPATHFTVFIKGLTLELRTMKSPEALRALMKGDNNGELVIDTISGGAVMDEHKQVKYLLKNEQFIIPVKDIDLYRIVETADVPLIEEVSGLITPKFHRG